MKRINLDLQELQAFVAVAERSSFRAAAEAMHLSPPALSRRIEKLEEQLGAQLLERTTRRVNLTQIGRVFLERARNAIDELDDAVLSIGNLSAQLGGQVTVACVPSVAYYFLPSVIHSFMQRFPRIRLRIIDETANTVLNSVVSGRADFGVCFFGTQEPDIDFKPVLREEFVLALRHDHPLARRRSVSWEDLTQERFMTVAKESGNRLLIDSALAKSGKRTAGVFEVSHVMTLLGLVEAGLGVAAVPRLAMPPTKHPTLRSVRLEHPRVTRTLGLISRHGRALSATAQQLYDLLRQAGRERGKDAAASSSVPCRTSKKTQSR